jgi:hypothetical protein
MPVLLSTAVGKKYRVLLSTPSGREYMFELHSTGPFCGSPSFIVWEQEDGAFEAEGVRYSSMEHFAASFGCVLGEATSVEAAN